MSSKQPKSYFTLYKWHFELKHKHYYGSLSHLVRYVFLVIVGLGCKFEVSTHNYKLPDNYWYVFSQHSCPMLQSHSIKNVIFRGGGGGGGGANFGAYTDPSFHWRLFLRAKLTITQLWFYILQPPNYLIIIIYRFRYINNNVTYGYDRCAWFSYI